MLTRNRAAKLAYSLALIWLGVMWLFHALAHNIVNYKLDEHLGSFGKNINDFAYFLHQNDIGFLQQFSVSHWSVYVTIFLSSLGTLGGLSALLTGLQRQRSEVFSSERRSNILVLAGAIFFTTIIGSSTIMLTSRRKFVLQRLFVLEVHLVRFEGLLFNSLSVSDQAGLFETFMEYLAGYYARIEGLIDEISAIYQFSDGYKIDDYLHAASVDLEYLMANGVLERSDDQNAQYLHPNPLHSMLLNLEAMQEITRRNIRALET